MAAVLRDILQIRGDPQISGREEQILLGLSRVIVERTYMAPKHKKAGMGSLTKNFYVEDLVLVVLV